MRILIADKLSRTAQERLLSMGNEVRVEPGLTAADLPAEIGDAEVLVVRSTKVTADTISAADSLGLIIRAGAGVNTIDLNAAGRHGIYVANCPGRNTAAVAELTIGLMIAADRRIVDAAIDMKQGSWRKKLYSQSRGLNGRTLAILGAGSIGRAVAVRAKALGMRVLLWSRSLTPEAAHELGCDYAATPVEAARQADALSVHLALTDETRHFVGEQVLSALRNGAIFVNTSRGEIVDTAALKRAMNHSGLKVALDVFEDEPTDAEAGFEDLELSSDIIATPHIAASTEEASEAIAAEVVRIISIYRETGMPPDAVNVRTRAEDRPVLVVRHFNRVGVLAGVLGTLRAAGINIEDMRNTIFEPAEAAIASIRLDAAPSASVMDELRTLEHVIQIVIA